MKKTRAKFIAIFIMLFVITVTPACEAFWQALETPNTQVDDNDTPKNDQSSTSKGKGQG